MKRLIWRIMSFRRGPLRYIHLGKKRWVWSSCLFSSLLFIFTALCFAWSGEVVHVADGDTITVQRGADRVKVRLYGIDTPESSQWYGQNAEAFTSSQVFGKTVEVQEIDVDRY